MSDLEHLTNTLESLGFYYIIKTPSQPIPKDAICNLCVVLNTGLTVYKEILFYFKNEKFVIGSPSQPCNPKLIIDDLTEMIEDLLSVVTPDRKVTPGSVWKHFKGTTAKVITLCKHSETGEELVVYECSGNKGKTNHEDGIYARPLEMFLSEVDHVKYPDVRQKYRLVKMEG
jgi:hypothetical protein